MEEDLTAEEKRLVQETNEQGDVEGLDPFLLAALRKPQDRILLLKLDQDLEVFTRDKSQTELTIPFLNSYQRLLTHRTAQYFKLDHAYDPRRGMVLTRRPDTTVPTLRFSDLVEESPQEEPKVRMIMRRQPTPRSSASKLTGDKERKTMTMEERQARYKEARARIFGEKGQDTDSSESSDAVDENRSRKASPASTPNPKGKRQGGGQFTPLERPLRPVDSTRMSGVSPMPAWPTPNPYYGYYYPQDTSQIYAGKAWPYAPATWGQDMATYGNNATSPYMPGPDLTIDSQPWANGQFSDPSGFQRAVGGTHPPNPPRNIFDYGTTQTTASGMSIWRNPLSPTEYANAWDVPRPLSNAKPPSNTSSTNAVYDRLASEFSHLTMTKNVPTSMFAHEYPSNDSPVQKETQEKSLPSGSARPSRKETPSEDCQ
ncbi:hypothetical protein BZG36_03646 [Bifiguratus adelaidae]|uniref:SUZ domain-containing protein n=1 Tax=Bifiguratus adelaidae TaxID=1938954 RepID=A0A261XW53_9FUNG|nr:hypothetical protein BZG36_03646 [Bifiguratus adelaidae]